MDGRGTSTDLNSDTALRSIRAEPSLVPLKQEVLTRYATGQILEGLPYEVLIQTLEQLGISNEQARAIHSDAVDIIKPAREPRTKEAKEKTHIRNEHYRKAKEFAKAAGKLKGVKTKDARSLNQVAQQVIRAQTSLQTAIAGEMVKKIPSTFKTHAQNIDKLFRSKEYWSTTLEMFARAFESYVQDRTNNKSQYLVHGAKAATQIEKDEKGNELPYNPYPIAEERDFINAAFDNFVATLEQVEDENGNVALRSIPTKTNALDTIIDSRGVDYEAVRNVVGRIERGELETWRLGTEGERGRIAGGRRNVKESDVARRDAGAGRTTGSRSEVAGRSACVIDAN